MTKQKRSSFSRVAMCILLLVALILPTGFTTKGAYAATKPSITSSMTISAGSIGTSEYVYEKDAFQILEVENPIKKATYSFTSNKKTVVSVKTKGTKAYLTGVTAGTATITCQQKLNGKTTKVGTCKITVKKATVYAESYDGLPMGINEGVFIYYSYRNCNATYTFTSDSEDFVMKESVKKEPAFNDMLLIQQSYTAKKPGTYTVTVKETYNKKTRVVGKVEYVVKKATVLEENTISELDSIGAYGLINNCRTDVDYYFEVGDTSIIELVKNEDNYLLNAKKVGTTTVKIYEDSTTADESKLIGTCKITVEKLTLESLDTEFYDTESYVGGDDIEFVVYKEPYNFPDKITVTSSDPTIAKVSEIDEEGYGKIVPVKAGTVTITISCGAISKTETITIYADEDAMYED